MERNIIIETVIQFLIDDIETDKELIKTDANFTTDLGIDSVDAVDIIVIVEQVFGVKIKGEEMRDVNTLGNFYDFVEKMIRDK